MTDLFDIKVKDLPHVHRDTGEDGVGAPVVTGVCYHNGPYCRGRENTSPGGAGVLWNTVTKL